jgi:hypothetical protein
MESDRGHRASPRRVGGAFMRPPLGGFCPLRNKRRHRDKFENRRGFYEYEHPSDGGGRKSQNMYSRSPEPYYSDRRYNGRREDYGDNHLGSGGHWREDIDGLRYRREYSSSGYAPYRGDQQRGQSRTRSPRPSGSRSHQLPLEPKKERTRSKPSVQVDCKGMPTGKEVDLLHKDFIAFAKEMDPSLGWSK